MNSFLGMRKVHEDLQRLNKLVLIASKFAGVQCLENFCSKGLYCQQVREIPGYGCSYLPCREKWMLMIAAGNQSTCLALTRQATL